MSQKTLGQVAFEAAQSAETNPIPWEAVCFCHAQWERAGRAVAIAVLDRHHESIKAEGAAEERERLAEEFDECAKMEHAKYGPSDLVRMNEHVAQFIRKHWKP